MKYNIPEFPILKKITRLAYILHILRWPGLLNYLDRTLPQPGGFVYKTRSR
jgi:hypothetical protein